jgi:signal transduction histidine kinase
LLLVGNYYFYRVVSKKNDKAKSAPSKTLLDMLSIISHNVKGPVKYIQYITDHTLANWEKMSPEDLHECASIINQSAKDIAELLANMLYWAEIQKDELTRHDSTFDLREVIAEEIALHRTIERVKKITIENWVPKGTVIRTDANLLRLAFQNILSNALKFSFVNTRIWIDYQEKNGIRLLSIQDEGKGMSPEELESLLNNEFISSSGTMNEGGTGLGTSLTRKVVQLLGGEIDIESQLDAGTKVTLRLPL